MNYCPSLRLEDGAGLASTLRVIDCRTGQAAAGAFDRLFGSHGALLPALTLLLTLYVAIFAIQLLTGRARLGAAAFTPRMLTIGLALTFATSWVAYQQVVWNLATGAPDQIATVLAGTDGSATTTFADRVDRIVSAIAESAENQQAAETPPAPVAGQPAPVQVAAATGLFTPNNLLWGSGLLLLLGTVGVLVTAKVVLAVLLAVGPVFIVLALFQGTRGLFEGWLKATVSAAIAPMFATVIGGATLAMLTPLIRNTLMAGGDAAIKSAVTLFLATSVYCALMAMALLTARTIVSGWRLPWSREIAPRGGTASIAPAATATASASSSAAAPIDERVRAMISGMPVANDRGESGGGGRQSSGAVDRRVIAEVAASVARPTPALADQRLRGATRDIGRPLGRPTPPRPRSR